MGKNDSKSLAEFTEIILNNITDGVFTVDDQFKITSFNQAAQKITGISEHAAVGSHCYDVFRSNICENQCALKCTMQSGEVFVSKTVIIINAKGEQVPISVSTALLRDKQGNVIGGVESFRDLTAVTELRKKLEGNYTLADIVSKNRTMMKIFNILPQISESGSSVLIEGESGTGKELFARVIHNLSKRKNKKMIAVNCGALPDSLLESELFGYKAGAFTDARRDKKGRFAQADKGTIFLDEIGDISPAFQIRLLRFLQEKTYEPLGATESLKADVRVIAATNRNLTRLVEEEKFRQDLYYRINVIKIIIPPLRERREDIPQLVHHFVSKFNHIMDRSIKNVSAETMNLFMNYSFPGNVRQLENIIEHAFVLCGDTTIRNEHLPPELLDEIESKNQNHSSPSSLRDVEASFLIDALERNDWNRQATAKELGIHKTTLFRKIREYNLLLPETDGRHRKQQFT